MIFPKINSRNKRYNESKENFNLPQLTQRRLPFQQLMEADADALSDEIIPPHYATTDGGQPQIQDVYIFDPDGRRDLDNDAQFFN